MKAHTFAMVTALMLISAAVMPVMAGIVSKPVHAIDGGTELIMDTAPATFQFAPGQEIDEDIIAALGLNLSGTDIDWLGSIEAPLKPDPDLKTTDPVYLNMGAQFYNDSPNLSTYVAPIPISSLGYSFLTFVAEDQKGDDWPDWGKV